MEAIQSSRKVRVGIVGVGNCASSFVQGLSFYGDVRGNEPVPGLMNPDVGGYQVGDVEISSAFDVDARKVGHDVADAIYAGPNNTIRFADVKPTGVRVERGPTMDGPRHAGRRQGGRRIACSASPPGCLSTRRMTAQGAASVMKANCISTEQIRSRVEALGPWFHNLDLAGVRTAPAHFLGDYPAVKWRRFAGAIPSDLAGRTVLDIGCNAGFYSMEMKRRGAARVLGIDSDED